MKPYTILLLNPDEVSGNPASDTYLAHVMAETSHYAVVAAQAEASEANQGNIEAKEFYALLVIEGHHAEKRGSPTLPPDPEGKNYDRAAWAKIALGAFMKETGTDYQDSLGDLLCDLMHLSDRVPFDFEAAMCRARDYYLAETGQPGPLTL